MFRGKPVFILILTVQSLFSQEKMVLDSAYVNNLAEVVVTATRTEKPVSELPLPLVTITKKQLQQTGVIRLNEILNEQTGIIMATDESGFEGVQLQGITSDYIMVLIDGVPLVGRNAGNLDLSRLAIGNIEKIEVVKGPSSSLYGSEALGGVINIITKKPENEALGGDVNYRYASFNTQDVNININSKIDKLGVSFFGNFLNSDGYDLNTGTVGNTVDPFRNYTLNGRLFYAFSDRLKLFSSTRYFYQEQDVQGESTESDWNAHLRLQHTASKKLNLEYELYFTNYLADQLFNDPIDGEVTFESNFNQILLRPEVRSTATFNNRSQLTTGVGFNYETLERNLFRDRVTFTSQYVFGQYDFKPIEKMNLILGVRFDNHSEYSSQLSPKFSAIYKFTKAFALKGSVGYGFKAPDFRQLYLDFTNSTVGYTVVGKEVEVDVINQLQANGEILSLEVNEATLGETLNAESSVGINLGFAFTKKRFSADVNFFRNDFTNLIDTRILARKQNGQNVFGYVNFNEVYTTGLEFGSNYKILDNVTLSGGYQLLFAKDKEREEAVENGEVFARDPETLQTVQLAQSDYFGLPNRSRHTANFKVFYELPKWNANANFRLVYRSKFALFDSNGNNLIDRFDTSFVDGFLVANATIGKTFFEKYQLQIGANNLFGYRDAENIPNLPGAQFFGRITVQF